MPAAIRMSYIAEVLLAELIFLHSAERKPRFPLRYAAAWTACLVFGRLFPMGWLLTFMPQPLAELIHFIAILAFTSASMAFCFVLSGPAGAAACAAGYAVQHIAFHITKLLRIAGFLTSAPPPYRRLLLELCVFPIVYLLFFFTLGRYGAKNLDYRRFDRRFDALSISIIGICIGLTRVANYFGDSGSVTVSLYAITACFMALMVQMVLSRAVKLEHEQRTMELLWREDRKQYELSKKTIDAINIKYHDLKHRLRGLTDRLPPEELEELQQSIRLYEGQFKTGSETLDVLLTTYGLQCGEEGVALSYTGQGGELSFMKSMDLYSLFGNAISNAMEATRQLDDPEKRVVDIRTERIGDMVSVSVSNFFSGTPQMEDGLPVTTKTEEEGFHGYGLKSMRLVAERYGGSLNVTVDRDLFTVSIYLMRR